MLDFIGRGPRTCDGVSRRSFLKVGALAIGGLTLPGLLRQRAAAAPGTSTSRKSVILIWLAGGPSHIDMYDLKPNAPAEFRGEFKPIATNVTDIQVGSTCRARRASWTSSPSCGPPITRTRGTAWARSGC
jgi:hypothetical protein